MAILFTFQHLPLCSMPEKKNQGLTLGSHCPPNPEGRTDQRQGCLQEEGWCWQGQQMERFYCPSHDYSCSSPIFLEQKMTNPNLPQQMLPASHTCIAIQDFPLLSTKQLGIQNGSSNVRKQKWSMGQRMERNQMAIHARQPSSRPMSPL